MADGLELNAGAGGATLATDDAGVAGHVQVVKLAVSADGSATAITADAGGLLVNLGANNDVTVTGTVTAEDGGASLTVDNAALSVVGGGVEATALRVTIASDSTGVLSVDDNGGALTVDGTVSVSGAVDTELTTADLDTGAGTDTRAVVGIVGSASGGAALIPGSATAGLKVDLGADNDVTVTGTVTANLAAGTNNIGDVDVLSIAAGDNNIGNVDIVTMPNVTLAAGTNTNEVVGDAAHDAAVAGNPLRVGARADTALSGITLVADGDTTDLYAGVDGVLIVRPHANLEDVVSERTTNTDGASTAFASGLAAAGAGIRLCITQVTCCNSSAAFCTVDLRDGAAGSVLWTLPVPATGGVVQRFDPPLKLTANTALAFDASAATTTLTISANGFKTKL